MITLDDDEHKALLGLLLDLEVEDHRDLYEDRSCCALCLKGVYQQHDEDCEIAKWIRKLGGTPRMPRKRGERQ